MNRDERALVRERQRLLDRLAGLSLLLHGSYLERFSTCARPQCECHRDRRHGPRAYVVVYRNKRQRQAYVPKAERDAVRRGLLQHRQMEEIIQAVTDINLKLMQAGRLEACEAKAQKRSKRDE
jgi:hypothetical protein